MKRISLILGIPILAVLLFLGGSLSFGAGSANASNPANDVATNPKPPVSGVVGPFVSHAVKSDVSPPLSSLPTAVPKSGNDYQVVPMLPVPGKANGSSVVDSIVQKVIGPLAMPTPIVSFEGAINWGGFIPPDTNGEVGRNNYIQLVNSTVIMIYNKSGTLVGGPFVLSQLFRDFGGQCAAPDQGDPIVVYDQIADRWLLTQFAFPSQSGPSYECIAISTSPDPTGSYYRYAFQTTAVGFDDYPKIAVWPDAYYFSSNEFGGPVGFAGSAAAFNRNKMLVGDPSAEEVVFRVPNDGGQLPSDFDGGMLPPAGTPNFYLYPTNPAAGLINEYKFHVDWGNPNNSTFTGPTPIMVSPWNDTVCGASRGRCIPQPGTSAMLEAISDRFMFRLTYRNFGDHESLMVNHTVNADGTHAGIRWYEFRNPNGTPTVYQQGTYAPADGNYRWMGSMAMDHMGDIAIGYSLSSSSVYPSIRYAGRLVGDPLGQLSQGEAELIAGTGSMDIPTNPRWGDYSDLTVDPVDDCTFWYTTEYYQRMGNADWHTRIGSFKFPSCTSANSTPVPTSTGAPPTATNTPLPSPTVCPGGISVTGSITNTDGGQVSAVVGGVPGQCGMTYSCPGTSGIPGTRHYDSYTLVNNTQATQCVTVYVDARNCGTAGVGSVTYLGSFDPNNVCNNYLASSGNNGPQYSYSYSVPAGQTYVVVVRELAPGAGCQNYTLKVSPCDQGQVTPTSTPVPPTSTPTPIVGSPTPTPPCGTQPNWVAGPTLTPARYTIQGVTGSEGKVYVAGGLTIQNEPVDNFDRFNFATNSWESLPPLPVAVGEASLGAFGTRIYVAGGYMTTQDITTTLQIFDTSNNTWSFGAPMPAAVEAAAGAVVSGKLYVVGGDNLSTSLRTVYIYDIATNTWTTGPDIPDTNGRTNTYGVGYGGKVYVWGGAYISGTNNVAIDTLDIYDPALGTWSTSPSANTGGKGNYGAVSAYGQNELLVTDGGTGGFLPSNTTHIYSILTNTWRAGPSMIEPHLGHAQASLPDGRVLVYGGLNSTSTATEDSELLGLPAPCVTPTATATPCTLTFTDVPPTDPFYTYIRCLACRGIVSGYSDNTFRPYNNITRGQISKVVSNAAGFNDEIPQDRQTYTDVPNTQTFWLWIERLTVHGVMSGYPCGGPEEPCDPQNRPYFRPYANATRGQLAKIDANAAGYNQQTTGQFFTDVPPSNPFYLWIQNLAERGIMSGYPCGGPNEPCDPQNRPYFRWANNVTRGQASKIVANTFYPNCETPRK